MTTADDVMDTADVAALLGASVLSVRVGRNQGTGRYKTMPAPLREVSGAPLWLRADIEAWAATLDQR